jgi:RNase P/RNase MRP subunit POP5
LHPKNFIDAIWSSVTKLYGEYGASKTNLSLIDYNPETNQAIIRTNLLSLNLVRSSIATITSINGKQISLHVISISGTIKALNKNIQKPLS